MITRKTTETNIAKLIGNAQPLEYVHTYMQTMTSQEHAKHTLECPKALKTIAKDHDTAEVIEYGDITLGITIDGEEWACENPHPAMRNLKALPHEVWQYLNLAMGRKIEGVKFGDTSSK